MSKGSEQISRRWLGGTERFTCCGRPIVLRQVAETRTYVGQPTLVLCLECRGRGVRLGLEWVAA